MSLLISWGSGDEEYLLRKINESLIIHIIEQHRASDGFESITSAVPMFDLTLQRLS